MKPSVFQQRLLDAMNLGTWYSVVRNSGLPNPELPEWFYREQKNPMATIRSMLKPGRVIAIQFKTRAKLPVVAKCHGLDKPRRIKLVKKQGG